MYEDAVVLVLVKDERNLVETECILAKILNATYGARVPPSGRINHEEIPQVGKKHF
jgi:hypothetical protein